MSVVDFFGAKYAYHVDGLKAFDGHIVDPKVASLSFRRSQRRRRHHRRRFRNLRLGSTFQVRRT